MEEEIFEEKPEGPKFSMGQEVLVPSGQTGKIIEIRGSSDVGFSYAVAHGIHSEFSESQLKEA